MLFIKTKTVPHHSQPQQGCYVHVYGSALYQQPSVLASAKNTYDNMHAFMRDFKKLKAAKAAAAAAADEAGPAGNRRQ
jgi:hypothetical protein